MIVRELITKLGFKGDFRAVSENERKINNLKQRGTEATAVFIRMAAALASIASIRAIQTVADEMQSFRARIAQLPQTVGDAAAAFDQVAARASNANQSIDAYASFYIKAGNATQDFIKDQEQLLRIVDGAAFGLAASGANAVSQGQAFFQLGQAIAAPVVQMEEMNTLIDVAPDLFRELGRVITGANGNLKAFISTGKVTGKMLAEGLVKAADTFQKKMKEIPLTIGQALVLGGNRFKLFIDRINRETGFVTKTANLLIRVFEGIENGLESVAKAFGSWNNVLRITAIALGVLIGLKVAAFLIAIVAQTMTAIRMFGILAVASRGLGAAMMTIAPFAIAAAFVLLLDDMWTWYKGGKSIIGDFLGDYEPFAQKVISLSNSIGDAIRTGFNMHPIALAMRAINYIGSRLPGEGKSLSWEESAVFQAPGPSRMPSQTPGASGSWGSSTTNANVSVMLQVPMGTPEAQASFVRDVTDRQIRQTLDQVLRGAANNYTVAE